MKWLEYCKFGLLVASFIVGTAVPFLVAVKKAHKKRNHAQTEAEKAMANTELMNLAKGLIADVEREFKDYNAFLKSRGASAGSVKKNSVMTDLKAYAIEKGYDFDETEWSDAIDNLVAFTRNVNAKN